MTDIELAIDLFLAAMLVQSRPDRVVVLAHAEQRSWPLMQQAATVAWMQRSVPQLMDFSTHPARLPAPRPRFALSEPCSEGAELLRRAALTVIALADGPTAAEARVDAGLVDACAAMGGGECLVYGWASSPVWSSEAIQRLLPRLRELPAPPAYRIAASAAVLAALKPLGWGATWPRPEAFQRAVAVLTPRMAVAFEAPTVPASGARLRIRPSAVACVASHIEATQLLIQSHNKAYFGPRGGVSLLMPWSRCHSARLLVRNILSRIDGLKVACGPQLLQTEKTIYTKEGALLNLDLTQSAASASRWLHIGLPRAAWPKEGFCELSGVEITAEIT